MSLRALARYVNELLDSGQASVTEVATGPVVLHGVEPAAAAKLIALCRETSWSCDLVDSADSGVFSEDLDQYLEPFHVTIHKVAQSGELLFVSTNAFMQWLDGPEPAGVVRVLDVTASFQTELLSVVAWEEKAVAFDPAGDRKSPLETVKCIGLCPALPRDIRPYLLKDGSSMPWGDKAFDAWVRIATKKLMCSLASEVHAETSVVEFGGPPRIVLTSTEAASPATLGADGFKVLQSVAKWVYEFDREVETRHKLFSIEFARSVSQGTEVSLAFRNVAAAAFEGARIAHGFGLVELSKEALSSMADLRKTVAEDTRRLSEAMRQLSLGVAGALFYGLALVAARLASVVNPLLLDAMAVVGAAYVGAIVLVNCRHLTQQKVLRDRWRDRFYSFLRTDDYRSMVSEPLDEAEKLLKMTMWISSVITLVVFVAVIVHNHQSL